MAVFFPPCRIAVCEFLQGGDALGRTIRPGLERLPVLGRYGHDRALEHVDLGSLERRAAYEVAQAGARLTGDRLLAARYAAYCDVVESDDRRTFSFEGVQKIIEAGLRDEHVCQANVSRAPLGRGSLAGNSPDMYASQHGKRFYIKEQSWWRSVGARTVFLTTEELPCQVAERLVRTIPGDLSDPGAATPPREIAEFMVVRADLPETVPPISVPYVADDRARADRPGIADHPGITDLVTEQVANEPDLRVITDPCGHVAAISHQRAKGRNSFVDYPLMTVLTYPAKERYGALCALAERFDLQDVLRTAYRDLLFQGIGRNMGFRDSDGTSRHVVIIHGDLARTNWPADLTKSERYELHQYASLDLAWGSQ